MSVYDFGIVPLQQASLCLDCEVITAAQRHCAACGSRALLGIEGVLSRGGSTDSPSRARSAWRVGEKDRIQERVLLASRVASEASEPREEAEDGTRRKKDDWRTTDALTRVLQSLARPIEDA